MHCSIQLEKKNVAALRHFRMNSEEKTLEIALLMSRKFCAKLLLLQCLASSIRFSENLISHIVILSSLFFLGTGKLCGVEEENAIYIVYCRCST